MRASLFVLASLVVAARVTDAGSARATVASDASRELVREAREHEAARELDTAVRRYSEALQIDATCVEAYLGLGALRLRLGDAREAELVYSIALERVPSARAALRGRANARWALGRHDDAEQDLEAFATFENDVSAWRDLADWFGNDGNAPAQLVTWRHLLAMATKHEGGAEPRSEQHEVDVARGWVRALQIMVGPADPAAAPLDADSTRRALAHIARRGG